MSGTEPATMQDYTKGNTMLKSLMLAAGCAALLGFAVPGQAFTTIDAPSTVQMCGGKDKKDKGDKDKAEQVGAVSQATAMCGGHCKDKKDKGEDKDE